MAELSPAAQAVLDATIDHWPGGHNHPHKRVFLAAALRAAADQMASHQSKKFLCSIADYVKLHAIAAELEGKQ